MATAKNKPRARAEGKPEEWYDPKAVDEFLSKLKHPLKPVVEAIRNAILSADSHIGVTTVLFSTLTMYFWQPPQLQLRHGHSPI